VAEFGAIGGLKVEVGVGTHTRLSSTGSCCRSFAKKKNFIPIAFMGFVLREATALFALLVIILLLFIF
jgi:F0F1-type ATP synthase membrane subunit c/vacuolar-type H+-ATPase subunit K